MATIKAFTDEGQSRKLAEFLHHESADMYWFRQIDSDYYPPNVESIYPLPLFKDGKEDFNYDIPCWSLAALLDVLPNGIVMNKDSQTGKYHFSSTYIGTHITAGNPIDACVEMIIKLHEMNLL